MNRFGLPERLLAILVLMAVIDFGANAVLFDRVSNLPCAATMPRALPKT
jgi:hypothetical protein